MKKELRILPSADTDIDSGFYHYQEQGDLELAFRFVDKVQETCERLRKMPYIGSPRDFPSSRFRGLRQWPVKGFEDYLIFYRVTQDRIDIYRILHGRRDIEGIFEEEG